MCLKTSSSPPPNKPKKRKDREDDQVEPEFPKSPKCRKTVDDGHRPPPASPKAGPSRISGRVNSPLPAPINPSPGAPKVAGSLKSILQAMVEGNASYRFKERLPSKYLALDCEMVSVGPKGARSLVARVSVVNYHGAVQLDELVRERVVGYHARHSGINRRDLIKAKPFDEIQSQVAGLLKDNVVVGHSVLNNLKALSLEHPQTQTLDTRFCAWRHKVSAVKHIALRDLVMQELGFMMHGGAHSSVTDARAAMAIFRLHQRKWGKFLHAPVAPKKRSNKRKRRLRTLDWIPGPVNWYYEDDIGQLGLDASDGWGW
ncbi:ribonuclease H-like protein [Pleurotus eryngii]|uniref:Ribonuclease H-like protein n=1 Tax=Pleurotus eryngii TaxID=5323 RepID=A0A9P6DEB7_PLEER|nr:ribonuclease H-like protein [Pleurotus eryngii]